MWRRIRFVHFSRLLVLWFTFFRYGCGNCVKHASQIWQIKIHVKEHHSSKDIIERKPKSWGWQCEKWTSPCSQIDFSYNQSVIAKIVLNNKCISIKTRYTRMTEKWNCCRLKLQNVNGEVIEDVKVNLNRRVMDMWMLHW